MELETNQLSLHLHAAPNPPDCGLHAPSSGFWHLYIVRPNTPCSQGHLPHQTGKARLGLWFTSMFPCPTQSRRFISFCWMDEVLLCRGWWIAFSSDPLSETQIPQNLKKWTQSSKAFRSPFQWGLAVGIAGDPSIFPWPQQDPSGLWQLHGLAGQPHFSRFLDPEDEPVIAETQQH